MKALRFASFAGSLVMGSLLHAAETAEPAPSPPAGQNFSAAMDKAAADYVARLQQASAELTATRERIAREKTPLMKAQRAAEDRLLAAESNLVRYETGEHQAADDRNRLTKAATALHKNTSYLDQLAQDALKAYGDNLAPGEDRLVTDQLRELQGRLAERDGGKPGGSGATESLEFLLARIRLSLGGYAVRGGSTIGEGNDVKPGVFAFAGPQTYFRADSGEAGIVVRLRENAASPVTYVVRDWTPAAAESYFRGAGPLPVDASGGKALKLRQTTGTLWQHIEKGGYVAFAILGVGLFALLLIVQKLVDVRRLAVDEPAAVEAFLARLSGGGRTQAEPGLGTLKATTRELFAAGLQHMDETKVVLEEHLQAVLLKQRLHFERRLPLLAVIATAAPLMGLLGTVVGMVKTFALITVFGTGNAGKLASGISEVLVATELGLAVAIPTLVIHGFLSQRINRQLTTQERYALEFVTAAQSDEVETSVR